VPLPPAGKGGGEVGDEGVLPYVSHIVMCSPQRVGFLRRVGQKTGINIAHFAPGGWGSRHMKGMGMLVGNFELNP